MHVNRHELLVVLHLPGRVTLASVHVIPWDPPPPELPPLSTHMHTLTECYRDIPSGEQRCGGKLRRRRLGALGGWRRPWPRVHSPGALLFCGGVSVLPLGSEQGGEDVGVGICYSGWTQQTFIFWTNRGRYIIRTFVCPLLLLSYWKNSQKGETLCSIYALNSDWNNSVFPLLAVVSAVFLLHFESPQISAPPMGIVFFPPNVPKHLQ